MRKIAGVLLAMLVFAVALAQEPEPKAEDKQAKKTAVAAALTPADLQKLQTAINSMELARARFDAAAAEFLRVKAEVIGDHGLAPSLHDFGADGKSIVKKEPKK